MLARRAGIHLKGVVSTADAAPFGVPVAFSGWGEGARGRVGARDEMGVGQVRGGRGACRTRIKSVRVDRTGRPNPKGTP